MNNYLHIALWLVLFYDALIMLVLPSTVTYIAGTDGNTSRFICYLSAAVISLGCLYQFGFKKLPIIWLGVLLCFIIFGSFHCPDIHLAGPFIPHDTGLFNFKPMFECVLYFCLFMAVYSMPLNPVNLENIYKTLGVAGIIICCYVILQRLGMDQIYRITDTMSPDHFSRNPEVGGFISQPVYASAIIVMLLPFMVRFRAWLSLLGVFAVILTGNRSGMIAIAILTAYCFFASPTLAIRLFIAYMVILGLTVAYYWTFPNNEFISSTGRLGAWVSIIKDFITPAFPGIDKSYIVTGQGIGAFSIFFPFYNHSSFNQAHNEYLEMWRGTSFIGLFLLFKAQFAILERTRNNYIFASLLGISIFACTNPVWHIQALIFLTCFLAGLGLNYSHEMND